MCDYYSKIYFYLFNQVTDAIELLKEDEVLAAQHVLIEAQQKAEEMYIEMSEYN